MRISFFWFASRFRAPAIVAAAVLAFVLAPSGNASAAYVLKTLHTFCKGGFLCSDGEGPDGLVADSTGAVYGTAYFGGSTGKGTVFKLAVNGNKISFGRLHTFCQKANCADGSSSASVLVIDKDGRLYGTASAGGSGGAGVVFELSDTTGHWRYTVLYNFCQAKDCADGAVPATGLAYEGQAAGTPWDESSPLFGTTEAAGAYGNGVVFELQKKGSAWNETVIHNFKDSSYPNPLLVDSAGNIFGTSRDGGTYGGGLMYKLAAGTWKETTLDNFCKESKCADGSGPIGLLLMDASGNLFGTTEAGGTGGPCNVSCGVVFERSAGGGYSVLYNFCSLTACADGDQPDEILLDSSGSLFGGTGFGGTTAYNSDGGGVLFELVNNSGRWSETVLYDFCTRAECADGESPDGGLLRDSSGDIWGAAYEGGNNEGADGAGTLFELK